MFSVEIQKQPLVEEIGNQTARLEQTGINFVSNNVDLPVCGNATWEIDARCLKYERKIASGSFFDL